MANGSEVGRSERSSSSGVRKRESGSEKYNILGYYLPHVIAGAKVGRVARFRVEVTVIGVLDNKMAENSGKGTNNFPHPGPDLCGMFNYLNAL